ncbi:MAG: SAM-dependent DNA methyltransferase [Planctomycetes bacterium]|nr:SAM-dependent DNA methyltransferase [Planctomycetota bacterium]
MAKKSKSTAEFGDFQTPTELAREVCRLLAALRVKPASLLEPTCGIGGLFFAGLDQFPSIQHAVGAELNANYIEHVRTTLTQHPAAARATVIEADFFRADWDSILADLSDPMLVLGNLPWVTNAELSMLGSGNVPIKSNFQQRGGFDALTGKANFDISEWMLIRLMEILNGRQAALAMLCKSAVARKVLSHGWKQGVELERAEIFAIDASRHFAAAVDAALLVMHFRPGAHDQTARVYPRLSTSDPPTFLGFDAGRLFADLEAYRATKHLNGEETIPWRSGVKHDCSKVMELRRDGERFRNGLGNVVEIEETYVYPMLKSSDLANGRIVNNDRWMIVTQAAVGQATDEIRVIAPKTWAYLTDHASLLEKRKSSIYRGKPPFSVFGVGEYTFAPWKVAISGFYKRLHFTMLSPAGDRPVVLDDTSYFLPCPSAEAAQLLTTLLNSPVATNYFNAQIFWDSKRPITAELLRRLDLRKLAQELGMGIPFDQLLGKSIIKRAGPRAVATARLLFPE